MALKKTITTEYGIDVIDAYHRVECVRINGKNSISYNLRSYKDNSGLPFFGERIVNCDYSIEGENPIAQAYAHVKTLPEFAGAVDC